MSTLPVSRDVFMEILLPFLVSSWDDLYKMARLCKKSYTWIDERYKLKETSEAIMSPESFVVAINAANKVLPISRRILMWHGSRHEKVIECFFRGWHDIGCLLRRDFMDLAFIFEFAPEKLLKKRIIGHVLSRDYTNHWGCPGFRRSIIMFDHDNLFFKNKRYAKDLCRDIEEVDTWRHIFEKKKLLWKDYEFLSPSMIKGAIAAKVLPYSKLPKGYKNDPSMIQTYIDFYPSSIIKYRKELEIDRETVTSMILRSEIAWTREKIKWMKLTNEELIPVFKENPSFREFLTKAQARACLEAYTPQEKIECFYDALVQLDFEGYEPLKEHLAKFKGLRKRKNPFTFTIQGPSRKIKLT